MIGRKGLCMHGNRSKSRCEMCEERVAVVAYLRARADAAVRLAAKDKGREDGLLEDRARQLQVVIGDIENGLHLVDGAQGVSSADATGLDAGGI